MTDQPNVGAGGRRPYRMGRRLASIEETRRRITEATFELHATIGPARTTISAIAERAGVQRHTVYAHFPDLDALYLACTEHGMLATHMPRPEPWLAIADPAARLRAALGDLAAWYRSNERMLRNVLADEEPAAPLATEPASPDPFTVRMAAIVETLGAGWPVEAARRVRLLNAVLVHATAFSTWRSLVTAGLTDEEVVDLLTSLVEGWPGAPGERAPTASDATVRSRARPEPGHRDPRDHGRRLVG